jgi:hypothetical protein
MGKGVSFMEDDYRWHGNPPSVEQAETALAELGTSLADWTQRLQGHAVPDVAPSANGAG